MSFTRDFSILTPIDHTLNANWPSYDRNGKQDSQDRLADIISGFNSGETVKGILNLPFIAQSTPSTKTDQIQLYGKAVAGKTELHTLNEDGVETQVTSSGAFTPTATAILALVGPLIMPIGFVVTLGVSTNPNTLYGFGTWTQIKGKVIVGVADSGTFGSLDATGGEENHTLVVGEVPNLTIEFSKFFNSTSPAPSIGGDGINNRTNFSTNNTGGGSHNNLQPFQTKYIWQRTA